jgi:hypothetical protein
MNEREKLFDYESLHGTTRSTKKNVYKVKLNWKGEGVLRKQVGKLYAREEIFLFSSSGESDNDQENARK